MSDSITSRLEKIHSELQSYRTRLVAVSKTKPISDIKAAYDAGQRIFGENKVQELCDKQPELPEDIQWHMIGHLQSNKVKYIAPFISLIHGVDSFKLLKEINKQAAKNDRVIDCLLQVHIAREQTKFGLDDSELKDIFEDESFTTLTNIQVKGLMGMATFTEDNSVVKAEFSKLKSLFDQCMQYNSLKNISLSELSMGMSGDYKVALECGSTLVRIGSSIFGGRN